MKKRAKRETSKNTDGRSLSLKMDKMNSLIEAVISLGQNLGDQIKEVKETMTTKNELEHVRQDLLAEIRPIARAVDKDAHTIINHEKRITRIEKHMVLV